MAAAKMMGADSKGAQVYHGPKICKEKLENMLDEFSVPRCLFHNLGDCEEFAFNRATGFYWLKKKSKTERKIEKVGTVYYEKELSAFIQHRRLTKITGLKAKELFLTLTVSEILVGVPTDDKVKFVTSTGITRAVPIANLEPTMGESSGK